MMQGKKVTVDGSLYRPALPGHSAEVLDIAQVAKTLKENSTCSTRLAQSTWPSSSSIHPRSSISRSAREESES